jgi:hypothetical protein
MQPENEAFALIARQKGVARVDQLIKLGVPRHRINQMRRDGRLRSCGHGIVTAAGVPETESFLRMLGVLVAGHGSKAGTNAAIADITAAMAHNMADGPARPIHVVTTRRIRSRPLFNFHFTSRLPADEIVMVDGIPTTDPLRTWLDICDSAPRRGKSVFYRGIRNHDFTPADALARIEKESRQGRGGLVLAREIAGNVAPGAERAKSRKEDDVFNWILEAGLPLPERNVFIPSSFGFDWEIDLLYRERRKIAIDISLHWLHGDPDVYDKDVLKREDLEDQGYKVIVVTDKTTRSKFLAKLERYLGADSGAEMGQIAQ